MESIQMDNFYSKSDTIAKGMVYLDNGEGRPAQSRKGIPGVLVSNGVDIVETDSKGHYEIPIETPGSVFVIKPRGYQTTVDSLNLPRFYYLHRPEGSPDADFIYRGIPSTGPLPSSIDFPLYEQEEKKDFKVAFIADPQSYHLQHLLWYGREAVREYQRSGADFGVALGDIVGDNLDLYPSYNIINSQAGFPWYNVIGNHDLNFKSKTDDFSTETYQRNFGPPDYAFQYADVHFIVLNNVLWEGFSGYRSDGWPHRRGYKGHLRDRQLQFVKNLVAHIPEDELIIVCTHIPLQDINPTSIHNTPQADELLKILSGHRHTLSMSGHHHINRNTFKGEELGYSGPQGALHHQCNIGATCGSWYRGTVDEKGIPIATCRDGSPKGYVIAHINGSDYSLDYRPLGRPSGYRSTLTFPETIEEDKLGSEELIINVFFGSDQTKVKGRIDGQDWVDMERFEGIAPCYADHRERTAEHPDAGKGTLMRPRNTDHLWKLKFPEGLQRGWHKFEIEVVSPFSPDHTASGTFFVTAPGSPEIKPLNNGTRSLYRTT